MASTAPELDGSRAPAAAVTAASTAAAAAAPIAATVALANTWEDQQGDLGYPPSILVEFNEYVDGHVVNSMPNKPWRFGPFEDTSEDRSTVEPSEDRSIIEHELPVRDAASGTAALPISALHGEHFVRFRVVAPDPIRHAFGQPCGTVGVTDAPPVLGVDPGPRGRAWGIELLDGGWRYCDDAHESAIERGSLIASPAVGAELTIRIDCRSRAVSVAVDRGEFHDIPSRLAEDVVSLRPWAVSAFEGDRFQLVEVCASSRTSWTPTVHPLFPADARKYAVSLAVIGHHLAGRLPTAAQGAFFELWVSFVLPAVIDSMELSEFECACAVTAD